MFTYFCIYVCVFLHMIAYFCISVHIWLLVSAYFVHISAYFIHFSAYSRHSFSFPPPCTVCERGKAVKSLQNHNFILFPCWLFKLNQTIQPIRLSCSSSGCAESADRSKATGPPHVEKKITVVTFPTFWLTAQSTKTQWYSTSSMS